MPPAPAWGPKYTWTENPGLCIREMDVKVARDRPGGKGHISPKWGQGLGPWGPGHLREAEGRLWLVLAGAPQPEG